MKALFLSLCCGLALVGCGESSTAPTPATNSPSGGNPLSAPADYIGAAGQSKLKAEKLVDTVALNKAVEMFHIEEGRFPKDLQELADKKFIPKIPEAPYGSKITYDPATGVVKVVKQ